LAVILSAGNENERRYLIPLVERLIEQKRKPGEVWADRGYASKTLDEQLAQLEIAARISKRRRPSDPIPEGTPTREVWRGTRKHLKTIDPNGRHRWPVERTNAWLKSKRRIATRRDVKDTTYLGFIQLGMLHILATSF